MFREGRQTSTRKQEEKARKDPVKSHRPDLPVHGPGKTLNKQFEQSSVIQSIGGFLKFYLSNLTDTNY